MKQHGHDRERESEREMERRLWALAQASAGGRVGERVPIVQLSRAHLFPHKGWICKTVNMWDGRGLVIARAGGARLELTERGVDTIDPTVIEVGVL